MKEIFKPIPKYNGLYEISNFGRVRSLKRTIMRSNKKPYNIVKDKILKLQLDGRGYLQVILCNNKHKVHKIHQLVFRAFDNSMRNNLTIDHRDGNRENNHINNLQLLTHRENVSKGYQQKGTKYPTGVDFCKAIGKYRTRYQFKGKNKYLGNYKTVEEASSAYQQALLEI